MRRAMAVLLASAMLAGCPSTMRNRPADATAESAGDVSDEGAAGDGDVVDAADADARDGDAADVDMVDADAGEVGVRMEYEFAGAALSGEAGGVRMRATLSWQGNLSGTAGNIRFEGGIR